MKLWSTFLGGFTLWAIMGLSVQASPVDLTAPSAISIDYDPFTGLPGLEDVSFEFTYSGPETNLPSRLIITPEFGTAFNLIGTGLPIALDIESNGGAMIAGRYEMPIALSADQTRHVDLTFKVPAGQYADAGASGLSLSLTLVDVATGAVLADHVMNVAGDVPSRAQTNFAGTTSGYEGGIGTAFVDFGELIAGDTRQVNFQIRGNADVNVMISSENQGKMVNQQNALISPVGYSILADGTPSDLSVPLHLMRVPEKTLAGSSYPLAITLDPMPVTPFSGVYKDIITIDVTPQ